jgi:hypothetical protein
VPALRVQPAGTVPRSSVVKALNAAVDEVRKEQLRSAGASERNALKGLRWLLYRHSSNRSRKHTRTLKALDKAKRRIVSWNEAAEMNESVVRLAFVMPQQEPLGASGLPAVGNPPWCVDLAELGAIDVLAPAAQCRPGR